MNSKQRRKLRRSGVAVPYQPVQSRNAWRHVPATVNDHKRIDPARNWLSDFTHENGNYCNRCVYCALPFIGHKRRVVCRACMQPKPTTEPTR